MSDGPPPVTSGFTPGFIPSDYSYLLQRSHSLVTPTRRNVPRGLVSLPSLDKQASIPLQTPSKGSSTSSLRTSSSNSSLADSFSSPRLARSDMDLQTINDLVSQLPPNPKIWTPSQVALYLTHVLGLTPKPVVEDVTNYVRRSRMGGKVFMRLREKDLESEGLNLKWRKLMIEAVKKLRRDCLKGRIWGYEGGLSWPRQDDNNILDDVAADEEEAEVKRLPVTSMGTLKRLRDKKAIRGMIFNFENAQQESKEDEEGFVALGNSGIKRNSSSHSTGSSDEQSPRAQMAPIYGKGFVKSQAESFASLSDLAHHSKRKEFTKEELEHWFGSLSDQEAEALVNELQEDEELQQSDFEEDQGSTSNISHSTHSSISGESELSTPPPTIKATFGFTPLKLEVVDAIVGQLSSAGSPTSTCNTLCVEPLLCRDDMIDQEQDSSKEPSQSLAQFRTGMANGRVNRYRGSTYEPEDIEALGFLVGEEDDIKFGTARKISGPPSHCEEEEEEAGPLKESCFAQDSIRVKKTDGASPFVRDLFANVEAVEATKPTSDYMRHMSAHEASGLSPYKAVSPSVSRKPSQRRHAEGERSALAELVEAKVEECKENNATFGRKGAKSMQLTAMLKSSGIYDGPNAATDTLAEDGKKAEDESEWGVTVSRKASRKGTLARNAAREKDGVASRMAELFTPASPSCPLREDNLKQLERTAASSKDQLLVPLTTFEPSDDGKGSIRKQSMVLVERKKFEALARRMGVLESQLAQLEAASLPSLSELGSISDRDPATRTLDQVFAVPVIPTVGSLEKEEQQVGTTPEDATRSWSLPMLLGAIPSYGEHPWSSSFFFAFRHSPYLSNSRLSSDLALGLGAGIGFVFLSEVMGKTRH